MPNGGEPMEGEAAAANASARQYDWRPRPDPTVLTTAQLRETEAALLRTIAEKVDALKQLQDQRLDGMDTATKLLAETVRQIPVDADAARERVRAEFTNADLALRELVFGRIDGIDTATKLLAEQLVKFPTDIDRSATAVREYALAQIHLARAETQRVGDVTQEKFDKVDAQFVSNDKALTAALAAQEKAAAEQQKSNTLAIDKSEKTTQEQSRANQAQTQTSIESQGQTIADLKERVVRIESLGVGATGERAERRADAGLNYTAISVLIGAIVLAITLYAALHR